MSNKRPREETSWCTIESDPGKLFRNKFFDNPTSFQGIFSLLIEKLGVKGVQVEEIYDLEHENLKAFKGYFIDGITTVLPLQFKRNFWIHLFV